MTEAEAIAAIQKLLADNPSDLSMRVVVAFTQSGVSVTLESNIKANLTTGGVPFPEAVQSLMTALAGRSSVA